MFILRVVFQKKKNKIKIEHVWLVFQFYKSEDSQIAHFITPGTNNLYDGPAA